MFLAGRWAPLTNGALCLSTPKHNGKYSTGLRGRSKILMPVFAVLAEEW